MDLSQIAQIKGSLTNFMTLNPSFASSLFSNYADATPWLGGSGIPSAIVTVDTFYFNTDNGDVYFSSVVGGVRSWQYQCNYFDTHAPRIEKFNFKYTDINGGTSPVAEVDLPLPDLQDREYIGRVYCEIVTPFATTELHPMIAATIISTDSAVGLNLGDVLCKIGNTGTPGEVGDFLTGEGRGIYTSIASLNGVRGIYLAVTDADLTTYSAGEANIYYEILTLK